MITYLAVDAGCGGGTGPSRPDAHADALGDISADAVVSIDTATDQGLADLSSTDGPSDATPPEVDAADGPGLDRGSDGPPNDLRDARDGAGCGTLLNTSSPISATLVATISHNATGGPLTDGTYELISAEETISSAPAQFWRTFRISNSGTRFEWVIQDIGLPPEIHFSGGLEVMGTSLVMTDDCIGSPRPYPYDAQGVALTLYFVIGQPTSPSGRIFHYRARSAP